MLEYSRLKYLMILLALALSVLYAVPNAFPQDPAVQITANRGAKVDEALKQRVDALLKQALVAFTLHCASRPRNEHLAWTIGLQDPRLNLFLAGDNEDCTVVGRVFTENVREAPKNVFYSELMPRRGAEKRRSVVNFDGADLFRAVETFYATSEQRPAHFFDLGDERYAMLLSHPDCDEAWLRRVTLADVKALADTETLARIERRAYRWHCGCEQRKIIAALAPAAQEGLGGLFGDDEVIHVQCPRCAAAHTITREAMEAWLAASAAKKP